MFKGFVSRGRSTRNRLTSSWMDLAPIRDQTSVLARTASFGHPELQLLGLSVVR